MPVLRMEHYLVLSEDIEKTKAFYCEGLGMQPGFRPQLEFPGYWLYLGSTPCIHIADWDAYEAWTDRVGIPFSKKAPGTGPVDHIAFNATGYEELKRHLEAMGAEVSVNLLDDIGLRQIFTKDPNGLTIELNFRTATGGNG